MQLTIEEAKAQLVTVQAAISDLIAGKRINQLRVGSGTFQRLYTFSEVMLTELKEHRDELLSFIDTSENTTPTFRNLSSIPLILHKNY